MSIVYPQLGMVENGKFHPKNNSAFKRQFEQFEGGLCEVIVRSVETKRSNQQNSYMWAVVYQLIANETGDTPQGVHQGLCQLLLPPVSYKGRLYQGSTSGLSVKDMATYLEKCIVEASKMGIEVPPPHYKE